MNRNLILLPIFSLVVSLFVRGAEKVDPEAFFSDSPHFGSVEVDVASSSFVVYVKVSKNQQGKDSGMVILTRLKGDEIGLAYWYDMIKSFEPGEYLLCNSFFQNGKQKFSKAFRVKGGMVIVPAQSVSLKKIELICK